MNKSKYLAKDIAQWFVNRAAMDVDMFYGDYISNMKLQKMLFFAQGLSLAIFNKPLFADKIQAWEHGPVIPNVYHIYKVCGAGNIQDVNPIEIDEEVAALLEFVFKKYGIYSASQLRQLSHNCSSYSNKYKEEQRNIEISIADIKKDFEDEKQELIKEFNANKKELAEYAETCFLNSVADVKKKIEDSDDELIEVNWQDEL